MVLFFALAIVIAVALIYDQYFSNDNDALDRFGRSMYKGSQRPANKYPGRSSGQISRKHRSGRTA